MNKVVFIAGILTVSVVGGIFFCAGMFTSSYLTTEQKDNKNVVSIPEEKDEGKSKEEKESPADKLKQEGESLLNKIIDLMPSKPTTKLESVIQDTNTESASKDEVLKPATSINIDNLLNEIVATHDTADQCLTENVKNLNKEPVAMNNTKKYMIFIGYFDNAMSADIAQLMMAKGYPIHTQKSTISNTESYLFCGPFKKKLNAKKILTWLSSNGFHNAKIVSQDPLKPEEINLEEFEDTEDSMPINSDFRQHTKEEHTQKPEASAERPLTPAESKAESVKAETPKAKRRTKKDAAAAQEQQNSKKVIDDDLDDDEVIDRNQVSAPASEQQNANTAEEAQSKSDNDSDDDDDEEENTPPAAKDQKSEKERNVVVQ